MNNALSSCHPVILSQVYKTNRYKLCYITTRLHRFHNDDKKSILCFYSLINNDVVEHFPPDQSIADIGTSIRWYPCWYSAQFSDLYQ